MKPTQITDLAGIRIVAFLISDTKMLCNVIERYFDPDYERTIKSSDRLGKNLIGYRSSNYVVKLGGEYFGKWYEYQAFKEMYFEIQVATLLDFTWMEIEHDRVYKTAAQFPPGISIQRRFNLLSGLLELADQEFDVLSRDVKRYDMTLTEKIQKGMIDDLEISPRSLRAYLKDFHDIPGITPYFAVSKAVLQELNVMGIQKISQLDEIKPRDFKERYAKVSNNKDYVTYTAILRDMMIIHDTKKYSSSAFDPNSYNTFEYHRWKVYKEFGVNFDDLPAGVEFKEGGDDD